MSTFRTIMFWAIGAFLIVSFALVVFGVMLPESLRSGETTKKKLIWGAVWIGAFAILRAIYVDRYIPGWLDDIIGHW